ncbi:Glycosyltransferase family 1 protein [Gammaproteobacteria bacterium]
MNILHTEASRGWGGQEIRILEEARGLIHRGHQISLVCPAEARIFAEAPAYGVPTHPLPIDHKNLNGFFALRHWLKMNPVDVVNTHSSTDSWLAALASVSMADPPPIIRTRHLSTPVHTNSPTFWLYQRACQHVVVTGTALKEQLIRVNGFDPATLSSVPTGIDLERFQPRERLATRAELGLRADISYIGIVATLRDWKGHTVLFDALHRLDGEFASSRLLVVGDGPYRDRLDTKLAAFDLANRVDFVGHRYDPERWLAAMDLFVLPSWGDEGVSQALMQAMATGLPVITTTVGSLTEVVKNGETGLLIPPRNTEALAEAIACLLRDPSLAARLGAAAREFASRHCGREQMLDRMETIFSRFARHRGR